MEKVKEAAPDTKAPATPQVVQPKLPEQKAGPQMRSRVPAAAGLPLSAGASQRARMSQAMQRSVGNARVSHSMGFKVQTKLTVGAPNDPYEQEADRTADTVMRMPELLNRDPMPVSRQVRPARIQNCGCDKKMPESKRSREGASNEAIPLEENNSGSQKCSGCAETIMRQIAENDKEEMPISSSETAQRPEDEVAPEIATTNESTNTTESPTGNFIHRQLRTSTEKGSNGEQSAVSPKTETYLNTSRGNGQQLSEGSRAFMEPRFGRDLSEVRVHTDSRAADAAQELNAQAFTHGKDVYFGDHQYQPGSSSGNRLLAHELTHVIQQDTGSIQRLHEGEIIQRQDESYEEHVIEPSETTLESMEEGEPVEQIGIVQTDDGSNLWPEPERIRSKLGLLPQNTRVFVDRKLAGGWYSVYIEGHQRGETLPVASGTHGYVAAERINLDLPDPGAWLYRITKSGQGALALAAEVYQKNFKASWGKDYRYLVNVLVTVNEAKGRRFLYKDDPDDSWDEAKTMKGGQIWIPGIELVDALHGQVSSGSISYEVLSTLADIGIGIAAFIVGLLHGALSSIADIFIGAYDLIKMVVDIIVKLFKGTLISDAKAFFEEISKIKFSDIIEMVGAKWNHPNIWDRWKFRGYVIGYAIVEILLLIFSVGIVTAVKWAGKVGKLGKLAEYLSKLPKVQKIIEAGKALKGKSIDKIRHALKAAQALSEAHGWAARVLRIPMGILRRISEADIDKLKKLPQWARERFSRLTEKVMLRLLGCASPCEVDFRKIYDYLQELAVKGAKGAKLNSADDVLKALPDGLKKSKIAQKLRKNESGLMTAIREAGLTDADFGKLADFLTPGDLSSPAQAYKTFARYLTGVVPSKTGKDIKKLNEILERIIKAEPGRGKALKGSMFEQWVALYVPELASRNFKRTTFFLKRLFPPFTRQVDKWVPDKGEIWEIKHQLSKVPTDQAQDYVELLGKAAPDGNTVKTVNYLFPTKEAAQLNAHLSTTYGFVIHYIDEATGDLIKLL